MIIDVQKRVIVISCVVIFCLIFLGLYYCQYLDRTIKNGAFSEKSAEVSNDVHQNQENQNIEKGETFGGVQQEVSIEGDVRIAAETGQLLYKNSASELVVFDPVTKNRKVVPLFANVESYDISRDGTMIAYAQRSEGNWWDPFDSSVHIYNLKTSEDRVLENSPGTFAINPVFFPDGKRIAYVQRTYSGDTNTPSDGEIWIRDIDTDQEHRILGDNQKQFIDISTLQKVIDKDGTWDGEFYCIDNDEILQPKIGIQSIGNDDIIEYTRAGWAPECSGIWDRAYYAHTNGEDFLTSNYEKWAAFKADYRRDGQPEDFSWETYRINVFSRGQFIAQKGIGAPLGYVKTALYDKNQNEIFVFYNSAVEDADTSFYIIATKPLEESSLLIAYIIEGTSSNVYLKKIDLTEDSDVWKLTKGDPVMLIPEEGDNFHDLRIINENLLLYRKYVDGHDYASVYDVTTGQLEYLY